MKRQLVNKRTSLYNLSLNLQQEKRKLDGIIGREQC